MRIPASGTTMISHNDAEDWLFLMLRACQRKDERVSSTDTLHIFNQP